MMPPNDTALFGKEEIAEWYKEYIQWFLSSRVRLHRHRPEKAGRTDQG
jgi:hypothetical protein